MALPIQLPMSQESPEGKKFTPGKKARPYIPGNLIQGLVFSSQILVLHHQLIVTFFYKFGVCG